MPRRRKRLDPAAFGLPVAQLREGGYADESCRLVPRLLEANGRAPAVLMQVTSKSDCYISGIDEAVAILRLGSVDWAALEVHALQEGDFAEAWDTVLTIEGPYAAFAHLETVYLGVLARRTRVCTNARRAVEVARPKPIMFIGARDDHFLMQPGDGYAARIGGATMVATESHASLWGGQPFATIPHALIAAFAGDTVAATLAFAEAVDPDARVLALVDYHNDCVTTSVAVARALEGRLWGVRIDTAETMVDRSLLDQMGAFRPTGVNPQLVWNVRNALDAEGFGHVQIVASGGFDAERIQVFEEAGAPVDVYGVGAGMYEGRFDFTADIVRVDGSPEAKVGRTERPNPKLVPVGR